MGQSQEYIKIDTGIKIFLLLTAKEKLFMILVKDRKTLFNRDHCNSYQDQCNWSLEVGERDWVQLQTQ